MMKRAVTARDILGLAIATLTEWVGVYLWVYFADNQNQILGIAVLMIGLLAERISVVMAAHDVYGERPLPKGFYPFAVASAFGEGAVWIVWLMIWDGIPGLGGMAVATFAMFVMQLVAHSWQMSFVLNKPPILRYAGDGLTIGFSVIEALGTLGWLYLFRSGQPLWGAVALLAGFVLEHIVQGLAVQKALPPNFASAPEQ